MISKWVAIPEVAEATDGAVRVGYAGLPVGVDEDRIQFNAGALRKSMISVGGYSLLELECYKGDEDRYDIGGTTDDQGTMTAIGSASVARAESSRRQTSSSAHSNVFDVRNGTAKVSWNNAAFSSRYPLSEQFNPTTHATFIDRSIRPQLIRAAFWHNTLEIFKDNPALASMLFLMIDYDVGRAITYLSMHAPQNIPIFLAFNATLRSQAMVMKMAFSDTKLSGRIDDPIFYGSRPTRAVVAAGMLATHRLVRAR